MSQFQPVYRATVYELDGVTPLTPRAGSAHSDAFKIATASGVTGFQPYMALPVGKGGSIDPVNRRVDVGSFTVELLDKRTGTDNLSRWWTAFVGDDTGRNQLLGLPILVEESTDGGSSWANLFTGEVRKAGLDGSKLRAKMTLRDRAHLLKRKVFVGRPHASASYAFPSNVIPAGGLVESYGGFPQVAPVRGTVSSWSRTGYGSGKAIAVDAANYKPTDKNHQSLVITRAAMGADAALDSFASVLDSIEVRVSVLTGALAGQSGSYRLAKSYASFVSPTGYHLGAYRTKENAEKHQELESFAFEPVDASRADYLAAPADGVQLEFWLVSISEPTKNAPLYIDTVHVVQLMADLLDGYYGRLDTAGDVTWSVPRDATTFATFLADDTLPSVRFTPDESRDLNEVLEALCKEAGLGYYLNGSGEVTLVDMRPPASYSGLTTIGNADTDAEASPTWVPDAEEAITDLRLTYRLEGQIDTATAIKEASDQFPDVPAGGVQAFEIQLRPFPFGTTGLSTKSHTIDAIGARVNVGLGFVNVDRDLPERRQVQAELIKLARQLESAFGHGVAIARIPCRRTSNVNGIQPGDLRIIDVDALPDPATNLRGGARIMRCLGVWPRGVRVDIDFLDLGPNSVAVAPSIGTITATASQAARSITVPITLNASSERARVDIAVTPTSTGTRPADDSNLWNEVDRPTASGDVVADTLPAGKRVWVRARTEPGPDDDPKLPSGWVYAATPAYIDLTALAAPTGGSSTVSSGSEVAISWTVGNPSVSVLVRLGSDDVEMLPANSTRYVLRGLVASTAYTANVLHVDPVTGAESAELAIAFTTAATPGLAPAMIGLGILVGERV